MFWKRSITTNTVITMVDMKLMKVIMGIMGIMGFIMGIIMVSILGHSHRLVLRRHPAKVGRKLQQCQQPQQQLQFKFFFVQMKTY
jgi:uncharacterized membrane protein YciS (DUF1049 family)